MTIWPWSRFAEDKAEIESWRAYSLGDLDKRLAQTDELADLRAKNGHLAAEVRSRDIVIARGKEANERLVSQLGEIRQQLSAQTSEVTHLRTQVAKFDPDGDGRIGGRRKKQA